MRLFLPILIPALFCCLPAGSTAQEADTGVEASSSGPAVFPLIPILELVQSGELRWRPDWPADIPPDAFLTSGDRQGSPVFISLSDGNETFTFRRDSAGRMQEFPYFFSDACVRVSVQYNPAGAIMDMLINGSAENAEEDDKSRTVEFPPDFFPDGDGLAARGPIRVTAGDATFFVFFGGSPISRSETWYDAEGNPLAFYRAAFFQAGNSPRIRYLQTLDSKGMSIEDYFFDADGNITEISSAKGRYSALYRAKRPVYWERLPSGSATGAPQAAARLALQWDERGSLAYVRLEYPHAPDSIPGPEAPAVPLDVPVEYRYTYRLNAAENWTSRRDTPMVLRMGILVPGPGREWTRGFSEE
jgi:hypothetical protein